MVGNHMFERCFMTTLFVLLSVLGGLAVPDYLPTERIGNHDRNHLTEQYFPFGFTELL